MIIINNICVEYVIGTVIFIEYGAEYLLAIYLKCISKPTILFSVLQHGYRWLILHSLVLNFEPTTWDVVKN